MTAAVLPAVLVLPILPDGIARCSALIGGLRRWTAAVLKGSR
ncbi:hypothetical protein ACGFX4_38890 [Kitasatospora sp. NPDC048365]